MRLWPNCYYRTEYTTNGETGRTKALSTCTAQDISLMNHDIRRHDPFINGTRITLPCRDVQSVLDIVGC